MCARTPLHAPTHLAPTSYDLGVIGGAMLGITDAFPGVNQATQVCAPGGWRLGAAGWARAAPIIGPTTPPINDSQEAIVGAAKLGAFGGTFLGGAAMLRYGRRRAIGLQAGFFVAGPLIMAVSGGAG